MEKQKNTATPTPEKVAAERMPLQLDVTARLIAPRGSLMGYANVCINDAFVINDFKIFNNDKGLFVGMPSKPDKSNESGYQDIAYPITADFREQLFGSVIAAYRGEVEKLRGHMNAVEPPQKQLISQQIAEGQKLADKENAARGGTGKNPQTQEQTAPGGRG